MIKTNGKRILLLTTSALFVYLCFRYLLSFFLPFLIALLIAAILHRPVRWLRKKLRLPMALGATVGILLILSVTGVAGFFLFRTLIHQLIAFIRQLPLYQSLLTERYRGICLGCDHYLRLDPGSSERFLDSQLELLFSHIQDSLLPSLTEQTLRLALGTAEAFALIIIILVSAVLLTMDLDEYRERFSTSALASLLQPIFTRLRTSAVAYLRAQGIIMLITATLCTLGLMLIRSPYALLFGLIIALLDALPILGSGMILLPLSVAEFFQGDYKAGAVLLTVFILCVILREFLEPKLLGEGIGIRPLYTLIAMYLGIRLFGITGFLLGPVGLVIIQSVLLQIQNDNPHSAP